MLRLLILVTECRSLARICDSYQLILLKISDNRPGLDTSCLNKTSLPSSVILMDLRSHLQMTTRTGSTHIQVGTGEQSPSTWSIQPTAYWPCSDSVYRNVRFRARTLSNSEVRNGSLSKRYCPFLRCSCFDPQASQAEFFQPPSGYPPPPFWLESGLTYRVTIEYV
jgi:hypothetical protein